MSRVAVSIVSLLPHSLGPGGLVRAWEKAQSAGIQHLQMVPLRGLRERDVKALRNECSDAILSFEGTWWEESLLQTVRKCWARGPSRFVAIPVMFPYRKKMVVQQLEWITKQFPQAIPVDTHDLLPVDSAYEWNPFDERFRNRRDILLRKRASWETVGFVADTRHFREKPTGWADRDVLEEIERWGKSGKLKLLHFSPVSPADLDAFLAPGKGDPLSRFVSAVSPFECDIVIEIAPRILGPDIERLRIIAEKIRSL